MFDCNFGRVSEDRLLVSRQNMAIIKAKKYVEEGMSASFAAKQAAKDTGIKKGDIYKALQEE